jgi:hypothetical protein
MIFMKVSSIVDTLSYVGIAIILIITIFFENSMGRTTYIVLTYLLALLLVIVLSVKFIKRKRR